MFKIEVFDFNELKTGIQIFRFRTTKRRKLMNRAEIENKLLNEIRSLPVEKTEEILNFALFVKSLDSQKTTVNINKSPWEALQTFRKTTDLKALNIDTGIFDKDRKNIWN